MSIDELMKELQQDYIKSLPQKVDNIEKLYQEKNASALKGELHKIKGTGKTYGLPEVTLIAQAAEEMLDKKPLDQLIPVAIELLKQTYALRSQGQSFDVGSSSQFQAMTKP